MNYLIDIRMVKYVLETPQNRTDCMYTTSHYDFNIPHMILIIHAKLKNFVDSVNKWFYVVHVLKCKNTTEGRAHTVDTILENLKSILYDYNIH